MPTPGDSRRSRPRRPAHARDHPRPRWPGSRGGPRPAPGPPWPRPGDGPRRGPSPTTGAPPPPPPPGRRRPGRPRRWDPTASARPGQELVHLSQMRGLAGDHGHDVASGHVRQQRQHLGPDPVAAMARVVVGRVLRPAPGRGRRTPPRSRSGAGPGWDVVGRPGCRPSPLTPAPRMRFNTTVSAWSSAVWPSERLGAQDPVAGGAGPGLEVGPVGQLDPLGPEAGSQRGRRGRHDRGLGIRARPQAVIHVDRGGREAGGHGQGQQRQRVGAARHPADHGRARGREATARQQAGDGASPRASPRRRSLSRPEPERPGRSTSGGVGSRRGWAGGPGSPRLRSAARGHRPARRPR